MYVSLLPALTVTINLVLHIINLDLKLSLLLRFLEIMDLLFFLGVNFYVVIITP